MANDNRGSPVSAAHSFLENYQCGTNALTQYLEGLLENNLAEETTNKGISSTVGVNNILSWDGVDGVLLHLTIDGNDGGLSAVGDDGHTGVLALLGQSGHLQSNLLEVGGTKLLCLSEVSSLGLVTEDVVPGFC